MASSGCVSANPPALLEATAKRARAKHARVLHSPHTGCGGILEALGHFNFLDLKGVDAGPRGRNPRASPIW